jgi:hypothetical protein
VNGGKKDLMTTFRLINFPVLAAIAVVFSIGSAGAQEMKNDTPSERPPLPAPPPDLTLPAPLGNGVPKRPLAWRAKAYTMMRPPIVQKKSDRIITAQSDETFFAIIATCPQFNIRVESANSATGQLMARSSIDPNGASPRIVIVVRPAGPERSTVSASIEPENAAVRSSIDGLLGNVSSALSRKGAL